MMMKTHAAGKGPALNVFTEGSPRARQYPNNVFGELARGRSAPYSMVTN